MEERRKQEEEAEAKAKQLLQEHLDDSQAEMFEKHGYIPVIAPSGEVYRIEKDGYVHRLDKNGKVVEGLCVIAAYDREMRGSRYPLSDQKLMKKLMLECCEDIFRQTANIRRFN
jgi:hypothetical protein